MITSIRTWQGSNLHLYVSVWFHSSEYSSLRDLHLLSGGENWNAISNDFTCQSNFEALVCILSRPLRWGSRNIDAVL